MTMIDAAKLVTSKDEMRWRYAGISKSSASLRLGLGFFLCLLPCFLVGQAPVSDQTQRSLAASTTSDTLSTAGVSTTHATESGDNSYVIGNDDVLAINVWKEPDITRSSQVRSDGKISLPLLGEIQAAGRTPLQLEQSITTELQNYITKPKVTVIVEQINSKKYNILGEVVKPGSYSLTLAPTIMDAIAAAGGLKDFAKQKDIYVLRQNPSGGKSRITFNYKDYLKGKNLAQNIRLEPQDTIVVP
jgi:polysaccharide biosynthesis/export protein